MTRTDIDLETLIKETEDRITNNEYYEDCTVVYKDYNVNVRIKPISQSKFTIISKNKKALESAEFNTLMIKECVLNKHDNKPFTQDQIERFFTGGLATAVTLKCCEVSGITLNKQQLQKLQDF